MIDTLVSKVPLCKQHLFSANTLSFSLQPEMALQLSCCNMSFYSVFF